MRKICTKLVPKVLTDVQKQNHEAVSKDLSERIEEDPHFFDVVITGDKSWFFQYDPETILQSNELHTSQSPRLKKARMSKSRMKAMFIIFFDKIGVVYSEFVPEGQTVNGNFYYVEVLKRLKRRVKRVRPEISANWKLHHDNAPSHTFFVVTEHLTKNGIVTIPQPPFSPTLTQQTFSSSLKSGMSSGDFHTNSQTLSLYGINDYRSHLHGISGGTAKGLQFNVEQSGLSARRPLLGLPLTQNHRRLLRQCCDEKRMWAAEWNEVFFTDESCICLQHHDVRIRVWRQCGERMLNSCIMLRPTGPAPGIMV
ncbi:histone-lysine n-methyltransferase setmar-like protein [Trichonephila clavipes]|nr:histone-lysine n-methyltransferase setmar-like protein [Trichonephila clavipes]